VDRAAALDRAGRAVPTRAAARIAPIMMGGIVLVSRADRIVLRADRRPTDRHPAGLEVRDLTPGAGTRMRVRDLKDPEVRDLTPGLGARLDRPGPAVPTRAAARIAPIMMGRIVPVSQADRIVLRADSRQTDRNPAGLEVRDLTPGAGTRIRVRDPEDPEVRDLTPDLGARIRALDVEDLLWGRGRIISSNRRTGGGCSSSIAAFSRAWTGGAARTLPRAVISPARISLTFRRFHRTCSAICRRFHPDMRLVITRVMSSCMTLQLTSF
jgi:hypothetical protein